MNKLLIMGLELSGYGLLIYQDWKIMLGVFLVMCSHIAHKHLGD